MFCRRSKLCSNVVDLQGQYGKWGPSRPDSTRLYPTPILMQTVMLLRGTRARRWQVGLVFAQASTSSFNGGLVSHTQ
jgi:hypothetical protein